MQFLQQQKPFNSTSTKRISQTNLHCCYIILNDPEMTQVLLFSRTKHGADRIVRNLRKKDINSAAIHGDKSQNQRQKALKDFKDGKVRYW